MDIDDDETQRAIEVPDYGIEVDFSDLDDEEKNVSHVLLVLLDSPLLKGIGISSRSERTTQFFPSSPHFFQ